MGGFVVKEGAVPDFLLSFPVDDKSFLYWPPEGNLAKILALFQLGADIGLVVAVAGDAVRDDAGRVVARVVVDGDKACLDGVSPIIEN